MQQQFLQTIINSDYKFYFIFTGAGSNFINEILSLSGSSKFLIEARIPYSTKSINNILGYTPEKYVCQKTARHLALKAYQEGCKLLYNTHKIVGIGLTASIATKNERKDRKHNVCISAQLNDRTLFKNYELNYETLKYPHNRKKEESFITSILLELIEYIVHEKDNDTFDCFISSNEIKDLYSKISMHTFSSSPDQILDLKNNDKLFVLSGSFNPFHEGHAFMESYIKRKYNQNCLFEVSLNNFDKPDIDHYDISLRQRYLFGKPVIFTREKYFMNKANTIRSLFHLPIIFAIGADTLVRLINFERYNNQAISRFIKCCKDYKIKFLVFEREKTNLKDFLNKNSYNKKFKKCLLEDPVGMKINTSSTEIRNSLDINNK